MIDDHDRGDHDETRDVFVHGDHDEHNEIFVFTLPELRQFVEEVVNETAQYAKTYPDPLMALNAGVTDIVEGTDTVRWRLSSARVVSKLPGRIWRPVFVEEDTEDETPHVSSA